MDKLQPLIKHRFWILLGIVLPLAIYGYVSAGNLPTEAENRAKEIEQVKSGIHSGQGTPNATYSAELTALNTTYSQYVDQAIADLWERQKQRMVWPASYSEKVPGQFLGDIPKLQDRHTYQTTVYPRWIDEVYEHVNPVRPVDPAAQLGAGASVDSSHFQNQKVIVTAVLPEARFPPETVNSQAIWDAQIDSWFLTLLFDAIAKTNSKADSITDATVRRIDRLDFMGGTGVPGDTVAGAVMSMSMGSSLGAASLSGEEEWLREQNARWEIDSPNNVTATPTSTGIPPVNFSPEQEFGPLPAPVADAGLVPGAIAVDPALALASRYVGYSADLPYFRRGFYLSATVMQDRIPDLLVEFGNCDWPVSIDRFHVGVNPYAERMTASMAGRRDSIQNRGLRGAMNPNQLLMGHGILGGRGTPVDTGRVPRLTAATIPPFAEAALKHTSLVQVELCGRITMFKPPADVLARIAALREAASPAPAGENPAPASP